MTEQSKKITADDFSPEDASLLNDFFKKINYDKELIFDKSLLSKDGKAKLLELQFDFNTRANGISNTEN
ncbi:hypothetical protein [Carnobacterium maltaromaticum]|uniref:hypothetical protein n=1 Tax=Carnobacterium maltaromaticum TaxID=2751 RepID=UPI0010715DFD|nr:hypothetical protein [Carnobacterium maltaromaticum]TFJ76317.1 hypothetical protein CKN94_02825 [Carnobacterium maltaromaticum]TFJ79117.1 hypothetical protein CKN97_02820 [Carnobacterium maltaromaticum]